MRERARIGYLCAALLALLALTPTAGGCGDDGDDDDDDSGPYDDLPIDETITGSGVAAPVDVIRDEHGVPHIHAASIADLAFAQGYVMASDRIEQMDLFRHFASGRVAELFGALDPGQIDGDFEMRMHRFATVAAETFAELEASSAPADQELVTFLQRFSDGVNRFLDDVRDGTRELDPEVLTFFDATRTDPWSPADSLVIGRLQAFSLSYSSAELDETDILERAIAGFDEADPEAQPDRARRAGVYHDLIPLAPIDPTSTREGFPGVDGASAGPSPRRGGRPSVPLELLDRVRASVRVGDLAAKLRDPQNGSNNWVVGPTLAGEGQTLLANDPHLQLASPSIFYAVHLTVPGDVDVAGITFPGIPGVILGHNEHVAWGATTVNHDVTDFYAETVVECEAGGGDCVLFGDDQVPIESWDETLRIGALGTITEERTITFEHVPHHGPILPTIVDHDLAPRPPGPAISVRYTGHEVTYELGAFRSLWRATTVEEAKAAFDVFGFGAQNWVLTDDQGHIGWTTNARVPWRTAGCFEFDPANPQAGGTAPWWIVPGDGSCEWDGWIEPEYLPQEVDPARGYIATANADPVGATADGDPFNEPEIDGKQLYVGARDYDPGYRVGRITRRLEALADAGEPMTSDDMASIQADAYSNLGATLTPHLLDAIAALEEELATPGAHPALTEIAEGLDAGERARIAAATDLLEGWTFDTPAGIDAADGSAEGDDSAATVVFNAWAVYFTDLVAGDEAAVVGRGPGTWLAPLLVAIYEDPEGLHTGIAEETGEPLICDDLGTGSPAIEGCTEMAVRALAAALAWGAGASRFGDDDPATWRWGELHRLTLGALLPSDALSVPPPDEPDEALAGGYPRHGDNFSVDSSSPGTGDFDFTYGHGPAMRHVTVLGGEGGPRTMLAIPGGEIMDTRSPHWRDLMDDYWSVNAYFELPWTVAQVREHYESRWRIE